MIRLIKSILLILLLCVASTATLFVARHHIPQLKNLPQISLPLDKLQVSNLSFLQQIPTPVKVLISETQKTITEKINSGAVLGTQTSSTASESAEKQPIHQQILEKARYQYCQQVVTDYEQRFGKTAQ